MPGFLSTVNGLHGHCALFLRCLGLGPALTAILRKANFLNGRTSGMGMLTMQEEQDPSHVFEKQHHWSTGVSMSFASI